MKTKLVYVLTCAPDDNYIEQALIAVWSARYYNPEAEIILLTDDLTNKLFVGKRAEILDYISEKIVVPFDASKSIHYRSRWLKTSVRQLLQGDLLFIDCDTIVNYDLSPIEQTDAEIAMALDENVDVKGHEKLTMLAIENKCRTVGVDVMKEKYYFNSGVMYIRDTALTHQLFEKWHAYWEEGVNKGINVDQPTLAKANIECGRPIVLLNDRWNAIAYSQIEEIYDAYIIHYWHGKSFLYSTKGMNYIRDNGMDDFVKYYTLHSTHSFIPFDNHVYHYKCSDYQRFYSITKKSLKDYGEHIDGTFEDFDINMSTNKIIRWTLRHNMLRLSSLLIVMSKYYRVKYSKKFTYKKNVYEN